MTKLRPVLAAAGLLVGSLALASPVIACPGHQETPQATTKVAAVAVSPSIECGMSRREQGCCGAASLGTQLLAAGVPAGLVAFGLGWLTGGRRRKENRALNRITRTTILLRPWRERDAHSSLPILWCLFWGSDSLAANL